MKPGEFPPIDLTLPRFEAASAVGMMLNQPAIKALLPVFALALIAPAVWWLFRKTWQELDQEAREMALAEPGPDHRPAVALVLMAVTLTLHHYYGGRQFFDEVLREPLMNFEAAGNRWVQLSTYSGLYGFGWWVSARVLGYVVMPLVVWKVFFPRDSVLDMGLRTGGFMSHLWLYGLSLAAVFAAMAVVARQPDFLEYYPFYKTASRSWFDLLCWEGMYFVQFFALEFYFRGFILAALRRTMGSAAIFVMALPYCMIHFGKPYLEAHGAIVAGVVLGSLSMRTRSIYAGFLVHITVAGLMDYFALDSRHAMPTSFWP